jgi:uncharacterized circularly permuted ATP-grasp superfamily protein/uncharacterized alpha-E superfamily protein
MPNRLTAILGSATSSQNGVAQGVYTPPTNTYDEVFADQQHVRPQWQGLLNSLAELGEGELFRRWEDAQHLIRENGVTYNVYADPRGTSRPWQLDPIPLLITPGEFEYLERSLIQRARLFELILQDLYGPQKLLRENLLPPELIFPNPNFLRSCHGLRILGGKFLHLYAANLGRTPDGAPIVLGDRTQAPSGAGYALENRIVLSRTLNEAFKECRVQRLALFFRTLRDTLNAISPRNKDNPRIVLLTPGPLSETYFEHAYLARYLGYTLVEGGDLTVRDNRVYLKVLGGLQQVDVILRRLDDDWCDPLELRANSVIGIPGLVNAVRNGHVAVANALGTGVLESPAIMAFLPRLCRYFFNEDLRLPSIPTYWCGDPESLKYVLANLPNMVIKPALPPIMSDPMFPAELSSSQLSDLRSKIQAQPQKYVAQDRLELTTAPVLVENRFEPRRVVMRAFMCLDRDSYVMMPGGLTRVSPTLEAPLVSMQRGGGSKDTWVLSAGPVSSFSMMMPNNLPIELTRAGGDLPSRAADNLFWLGRYAGRAEGITRLLRGIVLRMVERSGASEVPEFPSLLRSLAAHSGKSYDKPQDGPEQPLPELEPDVLRAVYDPKYPSGLVQTLSHLHQVASIVRDRISIDMWRVLANLHEDPLLTPATGDSEPTLAETLELLNRSVITLSAFGGLATESMTRAEGWRFLDIGRKMERALHMAYLLHGSLVQPPQIEVPTLDALLDIADSGMTYRRRYLGSLRAEAVLDLLVFDESNPRSLSAQLTGLMESVDQLPRSRATVGRNVEQRLTLGILNAVRLAEVNLLVHIQDGVRVHLKELLEQVSRVIPQLSETLSQQYLIHLQITRHLANEPSAPPTDSGRRDGI